MIRIEHNVTTGEIIEIELSAEEIAERESLAALRVAEKKAEAQAQAEAQAKRQALLNRLGITEEEAKLLLG